MSPNAYLDHSATRRLLQPPELGFLQAEEHLRSWLVLPSQHNNGQPADPFAERSSIYLKLQAKPLLRVWDTFSGSIPDFFTGNRMLARSERGVLATRDQRINSLKTHAKNGEWQATPYISFTSSPSAAVELVNRRITDDRRGDQNLVVIDPRYRLQRGLPILDMGEEMKRYGVGNPYQHDYYSDHYLCIWEITPGEVVGTWRWDELCDDDRWYENIVMPAFQRYRARQDVKSRFTDDFLP
jgi:hypothetical protein